MLEAPLKRQKLCQITALFKFSQIRAAQVFEIHYTGWSKKNGTKFMAQ